MKSTSVFLLGVIVFTALFVESSTTPVESTTRLAAGEAQNAERGLKALAKSKASLKRAIAKVTALKSEADEALAEASYKIEITLKTVLLQNAVEDFNHKAFAAGNAALSDVIRAVAKALAKVTDADVKEKITTVLNWLKSLREVSAEAGAAIDDALENGTIEDLKSAIDQLIKSRATVNADLAKYVAILEEGPRELTEYLKLLMVKNFNFVMDNSANIVTCLSSLLPGEASA